MFVYSTCRYCGGLLHVTNNDTTHPGCTPKPTTVERLAQQWLKAVEAGDITRETELHTQIEELDTRPPRLLDAAIRYASWGWPVFPLRGVSTRCDGDEKCRRLGICQCPKKPATRHGLNDATTDPDRIRAWWISHPDSNVGLSTGHAFDVIDIDVPDGATSYTHMIDSNLLPDVHGQVATSRGGLHLYTPPTGDGNRASIYPGIDYRGIGGYIVAPPSTLGVRGRAWSWTVPPSPTLTGAVVTM